MASLPIVSASEPSITRISPFLALPAELRNEIYTLLLTNPHISALRQIRTRGHVSDYILPFLHLTPSLLRTCRQIYTETHTMLYAANTFAAHPSLLSSMPYLIHPSRPVITGPGLQKIRKWYISVRLDVDPKFDTQKAKDAFSGAEELEIDVYQASYGSCDFSVLRLFEGIRGVKTARIDCSTGCESYARWLEGVMMKDEGKEVEPYEEEVWDPWTHGNRG